MQLNLDDATRILAQTPNTLNQLLRNLPSSWIHANEGPDTWSPFNVLGHLIHGEGTDWIPRVRIILQHGESQTFEPFNRSAKFEQETTVGDLLDQFAELRKNNLATLEGFEITEDQLTLRGMHPELGSVTLSQLIATWVAHDLSHIAQTARVLCKQYTDEVGPWKQYLPIFTVEQK
jgi:hypothetical protein